MKPKSTAVLSCLLYLTSPGCIADGIIPKTERFKTTEKPIKCKLYRTSSLFLQHVLINQRLSQFFDKVLPKKTIETIKK